MEGRCPSEGGRCSLSSGSQQCLSSQKCSPHGNGRCCAIAAANDKNCADCGLNTFIQSGFYSRSYGGGCTKCAPGKQFTHYPTKAGCLPRKAAGTTCNVNGPGHVIEWGSTNSECESGVDRSYCRTRCCSNKAAKDKFCIECGYQVS